MEEQRPVKPQDVGSTPTFPAIYMGVYRAKESLRSVTPASYESSGFDTLYPHHLGSGIVTRQRLLGQGRDLSLHRPLAQLV